MTREERLELLKQIEKDIHVCSLESSFIDDAKSCAIHSVIEALEQEPCEDCISRQAVDELSKALVHTTRDKADFLCNFWEGLRKLPPVNPQPKTDVLDKIRAEIASLDDADYDYEGYYKAVTDALQVIDKYRTESEVQDADSN